MDLHEYQAKEVLSKFGIKSGQFFITSSVQEVEDILKKTGWTECVVKAQVHAGGRGKAGGVKLAKNKEQIIDYAKQMLGQKLITKQTDESGVQINQVMLSELINIDKEYYASVIVDRKKAELALILSREGGIEIEEVAHKDPEAVRSFHIPLPGVIRHYQKIAIAKFMGWPFDSPALKFLQQLIDAFLAIDASMIEINPMVLTKKDEFLALDAKIAIDDNALYRQKEIGKLYDPSQLPPQEDEAKKFDLSYVALHGTIGCMVNGAGLAMATMDIIQYFGGKPANFLDVGGSATKEKVADMEETGVDDTMEIGIVMVIGIVVLTGVTIATFIPIIIAPIHLITILTQVATIILIQVVAITTITIHMMMTTIITIPQVAPDFQSV